MAANLRSIRANMAGRLEKRLRQAGHPRVQMALMVSATGSAGLLLDWLMLKAGVERMALRYALAVLLAYLVFLLLIKVWLVFHRRRQEGSGWSLDLSGGTGSSSGGGSVGGGGGADFRGGGGFSGGGGASASFGEGEPAPMILAPQAPASGGGGFSGGGGGGGSFSLDGDEGLAIILLVVALAAAFIAAIYLIVQAPAILGEILLDGSLSAGLYKRLQTLDHPSWLETAVKKTSLPFALVAVLAGTAGHFAQKAAPEARSIGGVWRHILDKA